MSEHGNEGDKEKYWYYKYQLDKFDSELRYGY